MGSIVTSTDGLIWSTGTSGTSAWLLATAHSETLHVVVGDHGTILTSADATTWTPRASGTTERLNGIAFGGGHRPRRHLRSTLNPPERSAESPDGPIKSATA